MKVKTIKVNYGVTKNMGNYESLRLDYGVELNTESRHSETQEQLNSVRRYIRELVEEAIKEEVDYLHGKSKPRIRG